MNKDQFVNRNISIIYRYGQKFLAKKLRELSPPLEVGQFPFLMQVYRYPGITQDQISTNAAMDKGTCARCIKQLERAGLVIKEEDKDDRRMNHIYPSEIALSIKEQIYAIVTELHKVLYSNFTEEEINEIIRLLNRMKENIQGYLEKE